jgi:hypothetical protein
MQRLSNYIPNLVYILIFLMPLAQKLLPLVIVLITLCVIFEHQALKNLQKTIQQKAFWINSGIFWAFLFGMIYTENQSNGWKEIETKLSLLLFPMIFSASNQLKKLNFIFLFKALFWACFIHASFLLWRASSLFLYELYARNNRIILDVYPFTNHFFGAYLSPFLHTGYFALFINVALGFIMYQYWIVKNKSFSNYLYPASFLVVFLFLMQSKIGILTAIITFLIVFWHKYGIENKKKLLSKIAIAVMSALILLVIIFPNTGKGFYQAIHTILNPSVETLNSYDGSASRVAAWMAATQIIKQEYLSGVGTGDARPAIVKKQLEMGFVKAAEHNLNAHNQFLQTTVALGVVGLSILLLFISFQFISAKSNNNFMALIFIIAVTFQFLIEVSLDTQAGVIFIGFFSNYFIFSTPNNHLQNHNQNE